MEQNSDGLFINTNADNITDYFNNQEIFKNNLEKMKIYERESKEYNGMYIQINIGNKEDI
jgi:hypothetical protein